MKLTTLTAIFCIFSITAFGQASLKFNPKYKPKTLEEAIFQLEKLHHDTVKVKITAMTEEQFTIGSHFAMGMWIRNNWRLWGGGKLSKYFNSIGIFHADDMSGIILTSYYRHLKGQNRELEKQIKYYQDYWKTSAEHFERLKTDTLYQEQIQKQQDSLKTLN